ncbi:MAG: response regulator [Deltaproteobacteria bacterium]|nr:response regulator [Candidatus Anaeroferrophillacea bacterium]
MARNRVMIVDDEAPIRDILTNVVQREGLVCDAYPDGQDALEAIRSRNDDILLVITDIKMPVMDGITLIREAKKAVPDLPFVIASGFGTKNDIITALKLGALDYLEKPFRLKEITGTLRKVKRVVSETHRTALVCRCLEERRSTFHIGNDIDLAQSLVNELVDEVGKFCGRDSTVSLAGVRMALHEALINAIEHGNLQLSSHLKEEANYLDLLQQRANELPYRDRSVHITSIIGNRLFRCRITDEGPGFDWRRLPDPTDPENLFKPHGRGLILIANYFDNITFSDQGNTISMELKLD